MPYLCSTFMLTLACFAGLSNARVFPAASTTPTFGLFIESQNGIDHADASQSIGLVYSGLWHRPDLVTIHVDPLSTAASDEAAEMTLITCSTTQIDQFDSLSNLRSDSGLILHISQ